MPQYTRKKETAIYPVKHLTAKEQYGLVMHLLQDGDYELGRILDFDNEQRIAHIVFQKEGHWEREDWTRYPSTPVPYQDLKVLK